VILLQGASGVFLVVDLLKPAPTRCRTVPEKHVRRKKRKRSQSTGQIEDAEGSEAVQCLRYNSMLFMGFAGDNELVIVEQPWLNVVATLPDALQRRIYGT
jgi:U3 small nucleolar RNA-associated protein 4